MRRLLAVAAGVAVLIGAWQIGRAEDPPSAIKLAMQKGHKSGIADKVKKGTASEQEIKDLLALYEGMAKVKPPKGDEASWKTKTDALVSSLKAVQAKDAGAMEAFNKAVNCGNCHMVHKPG